MYKKPQRNGLLRLKGTAEMNGDGNSNARKACSTVAEFLDDSILQLLETVPKARGLSDVFENSKSIAGYESVKDSWLKVFRAYYHTHFMPKLSTIEQPTGHEAEEFFFRKIRINPSDALKELWWLVAVAAKNGEVDFFKRIVEEMRKAKRNKPRPGVEGHILLNWMTCCLWLATDHAASIFLQVVTGRPVTEIAYSKARERLERRGLKNYSDFLPKPVITGCTKQGAFCYKTGWTNLVPTSSR